MTYGIYVVKTSSNDNHERKSMVWYRDNIYQSMRAAKEALEQVIEMLNEDGYDYTRVNSVTVRGEQTDTTPYPTTIKVSYHIERR